MKKNKLKIVHIIIIIVGLIFVSLSAFHKNLWFDETYSVALASHSFKEIWQIGGNDVHPILYYWILHIAYLLFGNNIIIFRNFSVICIFQLAIIGYTHIRKDFGDRIGIVFSYLSYFLPVMCIYAVEVRMYAFAALLTVLLAIYAYRLLKENTKKNWTIFAMCSLALSYTHYYGLMTAGIINIALFVYSIRKVKEDDTYMKRFVTQAIIEMILYVPWIIYFAVQLQHVGGGFWVKVAFPDTLINIINFQYKGFADIGFSYTLDNMLPFIFAVVLYIYIGYLIYNEVKQKKDIKPGIMALSIYLSVIIAAALISIFISILFCRYIFVITGLLIFAISYFLVKEKKKVITFVILAIMAVMSINNQYKLIKENYAESNLKQIEYISQMILQDDIIIYSDVIGESILPIYFPENKQYFINLEKWDVKEAYKAYGPQMETIEDLDFLKDFKGRIWIAESGESKLYKEIENADIIMDSKEFNTAYHGYYHNIMLIEKK